MTNKIKIIIPIVVIFLSAIGIAGLSLFKKEDIKTTEVKKSEQVDSVDNNDEVTEGYFLKEISDKEVLNNAARPDVTEIGGKLYLAYKGVISPKDDGFKAVILDESLNVVKPSMNIAPRDESIWVTDIRVATDNQNNFWYAYESVFGEAGCGNHLVNAAIYNGDINLKTEKTNLSTGCATGPARLKIPQEQIKENMQAADDPTPFFHNNKYYVLSRAWDGPVNHMRVYDNKFNQLDYYTVSISGSFNEDDMLSQNAMVDIEGRIYVVGGIHNGPPIDKAQSYIAAIPLSNDLKSINGKPIRLTSYKEYDTRVTAAKYKDGILYVNYHDLGNSLQFFEAFDVRNNFVSLGRAKFQDGLVGDGHSSFAIMGNKIYLFYPDTNNVIKAKVIEIGGKGGQIKIKTVKSTQNEEFLQQSPIQQNGQIPELSPEIKAKLECTNECVKTEGKTFDVCATKCGLPPKSQ